MRFPFWQTIGNPATDVLKTRKSGFLVFIQWRPSLGLSFQGRIAIAGYLKEQYPNQNGNIQNVGKRFKNIHSRNSYLGIGIVGTLPGIFPSNRDDF